MERASHCTGWTKTLCRKPATESERIHYTTVFKVPLQWTPRTSYPFPWPTFPTCLYMKPIVLWRNCPEVSQLLHRSETTHICQSAICILLVFAAGLKCLIHGPEEEGTRLSFHFLLTLFQQKENQVLRAPTASSEDSCPSLFFPGGALACKSRLLIGHGSK